MQPSLDVRLLRNFEMCLNGCRIVLPQGTQRLITFLALERMAVDRRFAAERLWPDNTAKRASANLRSALWQGNRAAGRTVIECCGPTLRLRAETSIDFRVALAQARRLDLGEGTQSDAAAMITTLSSPLLPDWSDDWLVFERERWNQVRLHALEKLAHQLKLEHDYVQALEAALAAVAIEPVRESAHRTLIEIYLAEGNGACALKHYQYYRGLLRRELGVAPSRQILRLVQDQASS
jgi:DNA-binding SARP family transcriptional activator